MKPILRIRASGEVIAARFPSRSSVTRRATLAAVVTPNSAYWTCDGLVVDPGHAPFPPSLAALDFRQVGPVS